MVSTIGNTYGVIIIQTKIYLSVGIVEKESKNKLKKDVFCDWCGNSQSFSCLCTASKPFKLRKVEVTMQEIWQQTKPKIHRSKKTYTRKNKHKRI